MRTDRDATQRESETRNSRLPAPDHATSSISCHLNHQESYPGLTTPRTLIQFTSNVMSFLVRLITTVLYTETVRTEGTSRMDTICAAVQNHNVIQFYYSLDAV